MQVIHKRFFRDKMIHMIVYLPRAGIIFRSCGLAIFNEED